METVPLLSVGCPHFPPRHSSTDVMTKEKSKKLICQDDSLSIYQAFYKAPLCAAAQPPNSSYNLHIDRCDGTALIGNDCVEMTSQQTLKFD